MRRVAEVMIVGFCALQVFSPDGSTFAVPVWSQPHPGWHGHRAVALIDVRAGKVIGLVPGSTEKAGCCQLSWDPTGTRLFFAQYSRDHWTLRYRDVGSAAAVDVDFSLRDSFAMVSGPSPSTWCNSTASS